MSRLQFFDSTLRDGSHAVRHQLTGENIRDYCKAMDSAGMHTIIVGHGNGLGASSLQVGVSLLEDAAMLKAARENLEKTKLGTFLIPGFGTIREHIGPAIEIGVDLFCVGCHCTEADVTRQHLEFVRNRGKEAYGVLMMYHMASTEKLLDEALKMQSYGAMGVIIMDSAGASTPEMTKKTISTLVDHLDCKVGFHSHNNLGLAVANAYTAYREGASILDGTLRGFGAGAGNCQLEALAALLEKEEVQTGMDLYRLFDASENIIKPLMAEEKGVAALNIVSGMAGVFSGFDTHVKKAAARFNVDPRDIFIELGRRNAVGGQEDMIVEIAEKLSRKNQVDDFTYQLESLL
jgi:4-hydroxy 2-oxovalerate aldolase